MVDGRYWRINTSGRVLLAGILLAITAWSAFAAAADKSIWKPVEFAILRYNDGTPPSWNMYHGEKRGVVLLRLWKRYMLVNVQDQEVYDIDPNKIRPQGDNVEWSTSDIPDQPIDTSDWKVRDVGTMERIRFRFVKTGGSLDIQIPLLINGKPAY
jgi:hypothetical protein